MNDVAINAASGTGMVISRFNLYWNNDFGIHVSPGSRRKVLINDTIFRSRLSGYRVGCNCSAAASITIQSSIIARSRHAGILVRTAGKVKLAYVGVSQNAGGNIKGTVAVSPAGSVNAKAPGFLSVAPNDLTS